MPYPENLSEFDLGYLVGLLEGEGFLAFNETHRNVDNRTVCYSVHLGIVNTDLALLERVKSIVGYGSITSKPPTRGGNKPCYHWRITKQSVVLWFLKQAQPFLIIKKEKADLLIPFLESRLQCNPQARANWQRSYSPDDLACFENYKKLRSYIPLKAVI